MVARFLGYTARLAQLPLGRRDHPQLADAIVVLGAPLAGGQLSAVGTERVEAGVDLWQRGLAPLICFTGGAPRSHQPAEATVMAKLATRLGVPRSDILVECESTSTRENAELTAEILRPMGCSRVWLVSQPFHLRRARFYFRRAGLDALVWHADDSLQFRSPQRALRWLTREYAAWARLSLNIASNRRQNR